MKGLTKDIIILSILIGVVYYFFGDDIKFFFSEENRTKPYVDFYGVDDYTSGTQNMIQQLHGAKVPYNYYRVETDSDKKKLQKKMEKAGVDSKSYALPVINVNGSFLVNPNPSIVIEDYKLEEKKQAIARAEERKRAVSK